MKNQLVQILHGFKPAATRLTTFMAQAYQQPELCLQFQWGQS